MKTIWAPLPGSQTLFLTCPVYEVLLEGTRGGGKTDTLLMSYAQHVGRGFGDHWRGTLFRLTYPQLADVVAKSKRWFYQIFPGAKFNESDYVWKWPTGEMLYFRYGANEDDYWNYHGHEYPWLGFEELTNWRNLSFYEAMHSTCRSSHPGMPISKSKFWLMVQKGEFPKPIKIGRSSFWTIEQVQTFIRERAKQS